MVKAFTLGFLVGYHTKGNEGRILNAVGSVASAAITGGSSAFSLIRGRLG